MTTWTPDRADGAPAAIFQALGAASACWEPAPEGVFDSTRAAEVGHGLIAWLIDNGHLKGAAE